VPTRTQEPEPKPEAARDVAWDVIKKKYGSCNEERKTNGEEEGRKKRGARE
jgi:hypothetical protein